MTGPTAVSPTELAPKWDVTLTDGTDSVGLILGGPGAGGFVKDPRRIQRTPIQRTALKTSQGGNKYDDLEWPYMTIPQDDWSGGRGMLNFDDDASRYYDGNDCDTSIDGKVILGPLATTGTAAFSGGGTDMPGIFFEYKGALYFVSIPAGGTDSTIYINGDRGAADANTGALTTLVDALKSWTVNEWAGAIVVLTAGPGADEPKNWRTISSNTATALTVSPAWDVTHTTSTEYIITKTNIWTSQQAVSSPVTDVAVSGDVVFFACGFDANTKVYREYRNTSGVWTKSLYTGSVPRSEKLLSLLQPDGTYKLFGTSREYNEDFDYPQAKRIWSATVFTTSSASRVYKDYGEVFPTNVPWSNRVISNVTHDVNDGMSYIQVATGFTTGTLAVYEPPDPVDLTNGEHLGFWIKPTVTFDAGQLQLKLDNTEDLGNTLTAAKVLASRWYSPTYCYVYTSSTYTAMTTAIDGISWTAYDVNSFGTGHNIFIGFTTPFSALYFNVDNANSSDVDMAIYYHAGNGWNVLSKTDGTQVGAATLAKDGRVTFTPPDAWKPSIVNSIEAYWLLVIPDATLDSSVSIAEIQVCAVNQDLPNLYDISSATADYMTLRTTDYMYVGHTDKFNKVSIGVGVANDGASVMTAEYFRGDTFASLTITDGTASGGVTLAATGDVTFTIPYDWELTTIEGTEAYWVRFDVSADLQASGSPINMPALSYVVVTRQNNVTIDLPALGDFDWTYVVITPTVGFNKYPYPDCTQIKSIALVSTANKDSYNIRLHGGIHLLDDGEDIVGIEDEVRVNNIVPYGSSSGIGINPYILTESGVYEIQQENDNAIVKLPIGEISAFASHNNGVAYCTNDVYLYFNLGRKIERYYNGNLEDIGPDLDSGLPANRQGDISALVSYPGRVYASIDAGSGTKYSSILLYKGNGWHEMYRAAAGERIYKMYYQAIPGSNTGRLWFSQSDDLKWIPVSTNPDTDTDYRFTSTGYIETGWIYAGMLAINKVFDSLTVFLENTTEEKQYIRAHYQTDENSSWTFISHYNSLIESHDIASTRPTGRRIRFRLTLNSDSSTVTPELIAYSVDLYGIVPVKYQYTWTALLSEFNGYDVNLDGEEQIALGYSNAAETALAKLDAWTDAATVLTMNSRFSVYDSKTVLLTAPAHVPVDINSELQLERHVLNITCHDL